MQAQKLDKSGAAAGSMPLHPALTQGLCLGWHYEDVGRGIRRAELLAMQHPGEHRGRVHEVLLELLTCRPIAHKC